MSVQLYMDHHVDTAITEGFRHRGVDVLTAYEDSAAEMEDADLLARATQLERVLFSQDADLLVIADRWLQTNREFAGLVYAHQLEITSCSGFHLFLTPNPELRTPPYIFALFLHFPAVFSQGFS